MAASPPSVEDALSADPWVTEKRKAPRARKARGGPPGVCWRCRRPCTSKVSCSGRGSGPKPLRRLRQENNLARTNQRQASAAAVALHAALLHAAADRNALSLAARKQARTSKLATRTKRSGRAQGALLHAAADRDAWSLATTTRPCAHHNAASPQAAVARKRAPAAARPARTGTTWAREKPPARPYCTIPNSNAFSTARVRSRTPSLDRMFDTWFFTVPSATPSELAISLLE